MCSGTGPGRKVDAKRAGMSASPWSVSRKVLDWPYSRPLRQSNQDAFGGVIALGLSDIAELGWSLRDDITYITHADPDEPLFHATAYLPEVAPLPFCSIQSSVDEFITKQEADALFAAAQQPKLYKLVQAQSHSFGGNLDGLFQALRDGLAWVAQNTK